MTEPIADRARAAAAARAAEQAADADRAAARIAEQRRRDTTTLTARIEALFPGVDVHRAALDAPEIHRATVRADGITFHLPDVGVGVTVETRCARCGAPIYTPAATVADVGVALTRDACATLCARAPDARTAAEQYLAMVRATVARDDLALDTIARLPGPWRGWITRHTARAVRFTDGSRVTAEPGEDPTYHPPRWWHRLRRHCP